MRVNKLALVPLPAHLHLVAFPMSASKVEEQQMEYTKAIDEVLGGMKKGCTNSKQAKVMATMANSIRSGLQDIPLSTLQHLIQSDPSPDAARATSKDSMSKETDVMHTQRMKAKTAIWEMVYKLRDPKKQRTGMHRDPELRSMESFLCGSIFNTDDEYDPTMHAWLDKVLKQLNKLLLPMARDMNRQYKKSRLVALANILAQHKELSRFKLGSKVASMSTVACQIVWAHMQGLWKIAKNYGQLCTVNPELMDNVRSEMASLKASMRGGKANMSAVLSSVRNVLSKTSREGKAQLANSTDSLNLLGNAMGLLSDTMEDRPELVEKTIDSLKSV